ncbi:Heterokaryon incompatibility protein [Hyphodiscus hymeniophilus]|uniref:Heterokaryon incompatibility protein n=1 Tax=Hyphodiscus hymeniophilus TaxID=353542 RepID=A0A9P6VEL6_9HELO|nr:Heterokaryon incompatibility protein [Hyphodiscus hymeniophilus]
MASSTSVDGATEITLSIYDLCTATYIMTFIQEKFASPAYKALSYAWGSPNVKRPILVNGCQHLVTVNLESALRRLRRIDIDITLWVDALCINQSDNTERTRQVQLMHDIFDFAEEAIVYLGEVPHHGLMAMNESVSSSTTTVHYDDSDSDKLEIFRSRYAAKTPSRTFNSKTGMDYAFQIFCFLRLLAGEPDLNHLPCFDSNSRQFVDTKYQRNIFEGLRQLLRCRWWQRIWVIQEVVVPKKITMVYGSTVAPWDMFVNAARWDSRNRSSSTPLLFPHEYSTILAYFAWIILDIDNMRELWRVSRQTALLPLLRRFSGRKASDDRDKVYALLALVQNRTSIIPNYTLSVPAVFEVAVLDIIKTTKSLTVLAGDLGRKDRQDLPSWVPDWSAAYDDLDRRRAEDTEIYNATDSCLIYVQDEEAEELSGIRQHLGLTEVPATEDYVKRFNDILGTSDRIDCVPDDRFDGGRRTGRPSETACLTAIDNFYTARSIAVCLQNHGSGIMRIPGLHVDTIVLATETAYSNEGLLPVIRSWATSLSTHFLNKNKNYDDSRIGLGDAFRTTLCAGKVRTGSEIEGFSIRRINKDDHGLIATWFLQELGSHALLNSSWKNLFEDLEDHYSYTSLEPICQNIDATIRSATVRRTFFVTDKGYIGLGPANLLAGDHLYILLGGQTPFILREAGSRTSYRMPSQKRLGVIERQYFSMVGDCYTNGLMDGEAMHEWREIAGNIKEDSKSRELINQWQLCKNYLRVWRTESEKGTAILRSDLENDPGAIELTMEDDLESLTQSYDNARKMELYTSEVSRWTHQFHNATWWRWRLRLFQAARLEIKQINQDLADAEHQMDGILELLNEQDANDAKLHVYLV